MLLPLFGLLVSGSAAPTPIEAGAWIKDGDYPRQARRSGTTGAVAYRIDVDAGGRVRGCTVVASSGDDVLDGTTCRLLRARARFAPAKDAKGQPVTSSYGSTVHWVLPSLPVPSAGFALGPAPVISLTAGPQRAPVVAVPARFATGFGYPPASRARSASSSPPPVRVAESAVPPPDPAVRFGQLPNGLSYRILRNAVPPGGLSMRLRVAAGAVDETAPQAGYAHLVEHMTFRGTANVPDGQLVKSLQQMGLALGADTTANTTPEPHPSPPGSMALRWPRR